MSLVSDSPRYSQYAGGRRFDRDSYSVLSEQRFARVDIRRDRDTYTRAFPLHEIARRKANASPADRRNDNRPLEHPALEKPRYDRLRHEIMAFRELPDGWDSYRAKAPSEVAIVNARRFVDVLERRRIEVDWVAPTIDDSVLVVGLTSSSRQEWDFYSDGDIAVTIIPTTGDKVFLDVAEQDVEAVVARYGG